MHARATFVALTTVLTLLVPNSILVSSFPVGGDKSLVVPGFPGDPSTSKAVTTPPAHDDFVNLLFDDEPTPEVQELEDGYFSALEQRNRFRYPTGYINIPYTYGNSIDQWNGLDFRPSECAQPLAALGFDSKNEGSFHDAQRPFAVHVDQQKPLCAPKKKDRYIGVDLRQNGFSVGFVNAEGKPELIPNENGHLYTPTLFQFMDGGRFAVVGRGTWTMYDNNGTNTTQGTPQEILKNQVDLSKLLEADKYKRYSGDFIHFLNAGFDKEVDLLAVSREEAIRKARERIPQLSYQDDYSEILALVMCHIPYFDSRLEQNLNIVEEEPVYLSQLMVVYNLRDSSEDLVVMRYTKGYGRAYHLDFLAGYLPNDGNIQTQFSRFLTNFILDRFNRGIGAEGEDRSHKNNVDTPVDTEVPSMNDLTVGLMEGRLVKPHARERGEKELLRLRIAEESYVTLTPKEYNECKAQFLKERLSASVERALEDAGVTDRSKIDHLIVADDTQFQPQSTVVLEDIVLEGHKKAVTEYSQRDPIALGVAWERG
ncbi:hypothetical protein BGZ83_001379 [Gryganskiella cystojenkinii]|nr:hypothetical protein BGZ83_001379 [Gryganskiella cystojenkinii]